MTVSDRLQGESRYAALVARTDDLLRGELGQDFAAEWDLVSDNWGSPWLQLRLSDKAGARSEALLRPEEMNFPGRLKQKFDALSDNLKRIREWKSLLRSLFHQVRVWCEQKAPELQLSERPYLVKEELFGQYEASVLHADSDKGHAELRPIGARVAGAEGRVDVVGPEQDQVLIYASRDGGWNWVDRGLVVTLRLLDADLIARLIRDCLG